MCGEGDGEKELQSCGVRLLQLGDSGDNSKVDSGAIRKAFDFPPPSQHLTASKMSIFSSYAGVNDPSRFASFVGAPPSKSFDFVICGGEQLVVEVRLRERELSRAA